MGKNVKPPTSFWIVAILALLWNIVEIHFSTFEMNFIQKNTTVEEFDNIQSLPIWYVVVFIIALLSETLGSFMLFMRKKIAVKLFAIASITLVLMELYWLSFFDIKNISVVISVIIPITVIAVAIFLYVYSKRAAKKGWLR